MSRSSGWVTHVLLTRSRLCPRASPGSSLHLHVLSTPPAFVLSQDQTLREELLNVELSVHHTRGCSYTWSKPGCVDGVLLYCLISGCRRPRGIGGRSNLDAHFDDWRRTRGRSYTWSKPGRIDGVLRYCLFLRPPRDRGRHLVYVRRPAWGGAEPDRLSGEYRTFSSVRKDISPN